VLTAIAESTTKDVDRAVDAAKRAYETSWGLKVPGPRRGELFHKLADLMVLHFDVLAALEALDNGKTFTWARGADISMSISTLRYYCMLDG
jgi:aldehyde dehydrogenase (NAD+)